MGQRPTADSLWRSILERDPKNTGLYRLVASQMIEYRLYEEAARIYRDARVAAGNPSLFAEDLASLYAALLQYDSATREYVALLSASQRQPATSPQQLAYVQSRLASFTFRPEGLQAALGVVRTEVSADPGNALLRRLLAWLLMEQRNYGAALEEYRTIDRLSSGNGAEIFSFAQRAAQDRSYGVAAAGFRDVMEHPGARSLHAQSRFGYARALEQLIGSPDAPVADPRTTPSDTASRPAAESPPTAQGVLALYQSLVADYPRTETAAQALYRIGVLRHERLSDLDGARSAFQEVRESPAARGLATDASFRIAEILLEQNNLRQAREEYGRLRRQQQPEVQQRAAFGLAELEYFEGRFDSASAAFSRLTANTGSDLANDAIGYLTFLQENSGAPDALKDFAAADLLTRRKQTTQALERFRLIVSHHPSAPLLDEAWMRIGDLLVQLQKPETALAAYRLVADSLRFSTLKDRALMKAAEVLVSMKQDSAAAIATYEQLLTRFPSSLFAAEARRRIRLLRGDVF
jgi:outer membrane protein assembly factor BamD (BamD/ComL family)